MEDVDVVLIGCFNFKTMITSSYVFMNKPQIIHLDAVANITERRTNLETHLSQREFLSYSPKYSLLLRYFGEDIQISHPCNRSTRPV